MRQKLLICFLVGLAAPTVPLLTGCDRHIGWERERSVIGPIRLKDRVAYVDTARDNVIVVDVSRSSPVIHSYPIGRDAVFAAPTPDLQHLAVITRGEEAIVEGQIEEEPILWLVDVTEADTAVVSYPVESPFDRLAVAADGSRAIAYFSSSGPDSRGVFRNPSELAIIDLTQAASEDNPVMKTVRSFGSAPEGVVLSPPLVIPGAPDTQPRTFAFVLAPGSVTVIDTTNPTRNEVSVRLEGTGEDVLPREIVFDTASAIAYLRSDNARDVLEILIRHEPPSPDDANDNDFHTVLSELGAGGGPSDIAVYDDPSGNRFILAATPSTSEVVVIDAKTAQFTVVPTPDGIDRIMLFPSGADAIPRVALLASIGAGRPRVHLLPLDGVTDELLPIDLRTIDLEQPVLDVVAVPGRDLGMIVHNNDRTVLGLIDVVFGSVTPLQGMGKLDTYAFSADGSHLLGATHDADRVGFLELTNLHPTDLRLDHVPEVVFAMGNGAIYIDHGDLFGLATIVPSADANRSDAVVLSGFLLTDLISEDFSR